MTLGHVEGLGGRKHGTSALHRLHQGHRCQCSRYARYAVPEKLAGFDSGPRRAPFNITPHYLMMSNHRDTSCSGMSRSC